MAELRDRTHRQTLNNLNESLNAYKNYGSKHSRSLFAGKGGDDTFLIKIIGDGWQQTPWPFIEL